MRRVPSLFSLGERLSWGAFYPVLPCVRGYHEARSIPVLPVCVRKTCLKDTSSTLCVWEKPAWKTPLLLPVCEGNLLERHLSGYMGRGRIPCICPPCHLAVILSRGIQPSTPGTPHRPSCSWPPCVHRACHQRALGGRARCCRTVR